MYEKISDVLAQKVRSLFELPVSICFATQAISERTLWQEELTYIANSVPKRRREFAAGRGSARQALSNMGALPCPILVNSDRSPLWPSGFVGSISHCEKFCAAVVGRNNEVASLGFDAEEVGFLPADILRIICDDKEIAHFSTLPSLTDCDYGKLSFCCKEAFYKCYYPVTRIVLDFLDVTITISSWDEIGFGNFSISLKDASKARPLSANSFSGRFLVSDGFIFAGMNFPADH